MKNFIDYSKKVGPVHLVGISGLGMSGLGFLLREKGVVVTGSDVKKKSRIMDILRTKGAIIHEGHRPENVEQAKLVVKSSAIQSTNSEIIRAKELGIPIYSRGQFLTELIRAKSILGICGSHGKTTTTALCTYLLQKMGYAPGYMLGVDWDEQKGKTASWGGSFLWGESTIFVCETDESDGSFGLLDPVWTIVTNIEDDHIDYYGTQEAMETKFREFIAKTPFYGKVIVNVDDEGVQRVLEKMPVEFSKLVRTFGLTSSAYVSAREVRFTDLETRFLVTIGGEKELEVSTNLMGMHNVQNIMAVLTWIDVLGIDVKKAIGYCKEIPEINRRLRKIGVWDEYDVLDDYAHHPKEILMTIQSVRQRYKKVIACVEPHRYSRVRQFGKSYTKSIQESDYGFVFPVYAAGEPFDPMSTSEEIRSSHLDAKQIVLVDDVESLRDKIRGIKNEVYPAAIVFMGAGDASDMAKRFIGEG